MKARLAKKIAHTPIDRLAPRRLKCIGSYDARMLMALNKWSKLCRPYGRLPHHLLRQSDPAVGTARGNGREAWTENSGG